MVSPSSSIAILLIRFLGLVGVIASTFLVWSISMDPQQVSSDPGQPAGQQQQKFWFSISGLPSDDAMVRMKKLMKGLRAEFGGPEFEPHLTVVGLTSLTEEDAVNRFRSAVQGMKAYAAKVERVATGTSYYQCVFLLLEPSAKVVEASTHCSTHFGYKSTTPYMPHVSLIYGDLTDKEKEAAEKKAYILDECINNWEFNITRLILQKIPYLDDKSTKSWETISESNLIVISGDDQ